MKTRFSTPVPFLCALCLAARALAPQLAAQTPLGLSIQMNAGQAQLSVTGAVGTVCSVEYVTDLTQTNTPSAWRCLEFLQLPASPYLLADKSAPAPGQRFYRARVFPAPTNMVFIPSGSFIMGAPTDEVGRRDWEGPQTQVVITCGFWMKRFEVTQGDYEAVIGSNPSYFTGDSNRPVEMVSWEEAVNYCAQLTAQESVAGRLPGGYVYRLPTEAEWEYACRAGTTNRFSYGDDPGYEALGNYGWYATNSGGTTHAAGMRQPNPWGLYDLHGNVWEMCLDWFSDHLPGGTVIDPIGAVAGTYRVARGGSWENPGLYCRSACRSYWIAPRSWRMGFRPVLGKPL